MIRLLADNVFEEMGKGFRDHMGGKPWMWGVVLLVLGGLIAAAVILRYFTSPAARAGRLRKRLFRTLADANGLTAPEREILLQVARHYQVDDPVQLYIKRSLFEGALPALRLDSTAADALRKKLYT